MTGPSDARYVLLQKSPMENYCINRGNNIYVLNPLKN